MGAIHAAATEYHRRLAAFRAELAARGLDGFLLPVTDEYQGEYSAAYARRVTWLSGFDGSAGAALVLAEKAFLLVDGRYTIQAAQEIDAALWQVFNSSETTAADLLKSDGERVIGYDPWLHTPKQIERLTKSLEGSAVRLKAEEGGNPVDAVWADQPMRPVRPITVMPLEYAGEPHGEKLSRMAEALKEKHVAAFVITQPENLCWLLNIRGADVPYNPLPLAYGVLRADATLDLFTESGKLTDAVTDHLVGSVRFHSPSAFPAFLKQDVGGAWGLDFERAPIAVRHAIETNPEGRIIPMDDPVIPAKAIKNDTEIEGMRRAHRIDGVAVTKFIEWYHALPDDAEPTEIEIAKKLEAFRQESPHYRGPSFATIAGSGPNGAIVHYRATEKTNRRVRKDDILLLDSGGQYDFGTTDITRTLCRGEPSEEFKRNYDLVLKGHLALAAAVFPEGTTGSQLDALARQFLWAEGLDYDHGTGHGVGHYLCVHEGPQRISKRGGDAVLKPGMILSNEPGYYKAGEYGIRIENLILVKDYKLKNFLCFEILSAVQLTAKSVTKKLLNK